MSYLDLPRLYFAGRFFANPSTINNKLANYSPDVRLLPFSLSEQPTSVLEEYAGFQYINPYGLHNFCLSDGVVTGLHTEDGIYHGGQTPLGRITSYGPYAKIIDLDPDQQSISQIYGLSLKLELQDGSGFEGTLEATCLHDLWYGRVPSASADQKASGCFQSLIPLERISWHSAGSDSLLGPLREQCVTGLSIKFVCDAYQGDNKSPDFNYGRIIGIIGPGLENEPIRFPAERRLNTYGSLFGPAYWKLDAAKRRATIDISNSMPLREIAGESLDVGVLYAVIVMDERIEFLHPQPLNYGRAALIATGGILDLNISAEQAARLESHPLAVHTAAAHAADPFILREHPSLTWINCDPAWLRLAPEQSAKVTFHARRAGKPLAGEKIDLQITNHHINNRPRSAIEFPPVVMTDEHGRAEVEIRAHTPQPLPPRRAVIDSQVYYLGGSWQAAGELTRQSGGGVLSVLVFNEAVYIETPNWKDHIEPIFYFYARLYPGMAKVLGLNSYESVRANSTFINDCLLLPEAHPMHFPPSRDLAPAKAQMVCRWIELGMPLE